MKGHIRERGKGSWSIILDIGRDPATGRRLQKWHTIHGTKKDAQREMTRLLHGLETGAYVEPNKMPIRDYLKQWLDNYAKTKVSSKTFERYEEIIRCHLAPALGQYSLTGLRPLHIQGAYSNALQTGRRDGTGGLSARTVLHHHRLLHQALSQAVKWQMLARNPAEAVEPPRPRRPEMRALEEADIARLLERAARHRLHMIILIAVTTGLRRGEILALRWKDIDFDRRTLAVRQTLEETRDGLAFKEPKTEKSRRVVALPALAIEALKHHKSEQAKARLMVGPGYQNNDLICCEIDGRPFAPRNITNSFSELAQRLRLGPVRFHDLRHSHATILLRQGVHPKIVSERLGHATIGITLDVYSHVLPGMQEQAAEKVDSALRAALRIA